jgi:tRNA(Arg) A34 adenosine deaminase TadA
MLTAVGRPILDFGGEVGLLRLAVDWAASRARQGHGPFVGVVVRDGAVVGVGGSAMVEELDPTAHGEVVALRDAARRAGGLDLDGSVVYSNVEPCALCMIAAAITGAAEMVFATGKELVPDALDPDMERTSRLIEAVRAVLPIGVRRVDTGLTPAELSAPFRLFLETGAT